MSDLSAAAALRKAKSLLVEKGWTKYHFAVKADGTACDDYDDPNLVAYCASGALRAAAGSADWCDSEAFIEARHALNFVRNADHNSIITWNDDPATKKEDVLAVFDAAIKLVEEGTPNETPAE